MSDFTIVENSEDALLKTIRTKLSEGYKESELSVVSKSKLHIEELNDSEVSLTSTSGTFGDKMARLLVGEDGEDIVLSYFDLSESDKERYKKEILDHKYIVIATKDTSSHEEVEEANAAYDPNEELNHYAEESRGPKS
ncbi:general stress protein [Staphylococcus succinus]|uniref:general stress protein n=1 Tax=Staphylococcus succinus TaxID=61015 RepID=UPI00093748F8|nr:general stress protein [Staphylococcus succinus]PTJ19429.1 hypothetical protein BU069_05665 [Staphylococcus succinus]